MKRSSVFVLGSMAVSMSVTAAFIANASAQSYPARPISIILPFPPGSGNDTVARIIGPKITEELRQPVIVDNRPGAGGVLAADAASRAAPDGYTLFLPSSSVAINMHSARAKYDLIRDFAAVSVVGTLPFVLVVHASLPVGTIKELIALAKRRPKELNYASSGMGGTGHLLGELLRTSTSIEITHVPYKGSGAASTELISGQVHMLFTNLSSMAPHVKSGRLRALGVSGSQRSSVLPNVPTMAEAGYPQLDIGTWFALVAPAATPGAIVAQLNLSMVKILRMSDVREQLIRQGVQPSPTTVEEAASFLKKDVARWGKILKDAGITLN
ncbi:MAG: tripartite tricarboxylate transporter substrate binding protein [Betaproteobacteria bacterium]|nr:tripartite tricarboxylate transporter substrate binding protein [Betaproteobacteria bacterium]